MARKADPAERIIALIDMDCFYAQVEQRDRPELWGKPVAVVQYNEWQQGGLIAVNYEARPFGVKRNGMRGQEAMEKCPELTLVSVPTQRGKANLTKYRNASAEVFRVLNNFHPDITVERASVDEAFLDLSKICEQMLNSAQGIIHELYNANWHWNNRTARTFAVGATSNLKSLWGPRNEDFKQFSRQMAMTTYDAVELRKIALSVLMEVNQASKNSPNWTPPLTGLFMAANRFEDCVEGKSRAITEFFPTVVPKTSAEETEVPKTQNGNGNDIVLAPSSNVSNRRQRARKTLPQARKRPVSPVAASDSDSDSLFNPVVDDTFKEWELEEGYENQPGPSRPRHQEQHLDLDFSESEELRLEFEGASEPSQEDSQGNRESDDHRTKESTYPIPASVEHLPGSFNEIPPAVFKELPFLVQAEIRNHYKVNGKGEKLNSVTVKSGSVAKKPRGAAAAGRGRSKRGRDASGPDGAAQKNRSILDYYSKK